jgi:hypothetical protein
MSYIREDMAAISVSLDGVKYGGNWKSLQGGDLQADSSKTRPGGMGREIALGGPGQRQDLTCAVQFDDVVATWVSAFETAIGVGVIKVGLAWLRPNRTPYATTYTRTGVLNGCSVPDHDSESSTAGMFTIVVSCDELST